MSKFGISESEFIEGIKQMSENDKKALQPRGGIGMQLERVLGKALTVTRIDNYEKNILDSNGNATTEVRKNMYFDYTLRDVETLEPTYVARVVIAYDMRNFFEEGKFEKISFHDRVAADHELLNKLITFTPLEIIPTNTYPMKLSKAAQELGIKYLDEMAPESWKQLRNAYYRGSLNAKELRDDMKAEEYAWQEIKHIKIRLEDPIV